MLDGFRESDVIARFAGDEFIVLLSYEAELNLDAVLKRFDALVHSHNQQNDSAYKLVYSTGVAHREYNSSLSLNEYLAQADKAMFAIKALHHMRTLGAIEVHAILGPSICGKCYEVPFQMQQDVIADHPRAFSTTHQGTPGLDLPAGLIADLALEGVSYEASLICTKEDPLYYSHRRDNPTGRFAGVVSL